VNVPHVTPLVDLVGDLTLTNVIGVMNQDIYKKITVLTHVPNQVSIQMITTEPVENVTGLVENVSMKELVIVSSVMMIISYSEINLTNMMSVSVPLNAQKDTMVNNKDVKLVILPVELVGLLWNPLVILVGLKTITYKEDVFQNVQLDIGMMLTLGLVLSVTLLVDLVGVLIITNVLIVILVTI
jgi:hypothetical protein